MLLLSFLIKKLILSLPLLCAGAGGGGLLLEMAGLNQLPPNPCCGAAGLGLHLRGVGAGAGDITTNFSFVPSPPSIARMDGRAGLICPFWQRTMQELHRNSIFPVFSCSKPALILLLVQMLLRN